MIFPTLPAMERIAVQHNSTLSRKLIALCENFLGWVEETKKLRVIDGKIPPISEVRLKQAVDYTKSHFIPAVTRLFAEELNLNIHVIGLGDPIFNACMFYIFRDADGLKSQEAEQHFSGTMASDVSSPDFTIFANLEQNLDLTKGIFVELPKKYMCILAVFSATFLGEEVFADTPVLTAREHAAIILHELGHVIGTAEHIADFYHRANLAGNSVRYLNEKADDKKVEATLQELETISRHMPDADWKKAYDEIMGLIEKTKSLPDAASKLSGPIHNFTAATAAYWLFKLFAAPFQRMAANGRFGKINRSLKKSSDTVVTRSNASYPERIADEFVSRHGLGADMISALQKMNEFDRRGYVRLDILVSMRNNQTIWSIVCAFSAVVDFFGMLSLVDKGDYDPEWLRYQHVLQDSMVVFKDQTISDELRNYYLKQTTDLLTLIKTYTGTNRYKISQLFWGTIMRITSRGSVVDALHTAGLSVDYDTLQLITGGLVKNTLYYHAARLQSLVKK